MRNLSQQAEEFQCCLLFSLSLCLLQHSCVSFHNYKTAQTFPATYADLAIPMPKRNVLSFLGSPFIKGKLPQTHCKLPSELTGEDSIICSRLAVRGARKRSYGIFHLYKGTLVLPTRNKRSDGRWFKCVK